MSGVGGYATVEDSKLSNLRDPDTDDFQK